MITPAAMNCANLSNPLNGTVVVSGTTVGDNATYSCDNGFLLQGVNRRVCTSGGEWSGSAPTCQGEPRDYQPDS